MAMSQQPTIRLTPRTLIVPRGIGFVAVPDLDNPDHWGIVTHIDPEIGDPFRFVLDEETIPSVFLLFHDELMKTGSERLTREFGAAIREIAWRY